jgi:putative NADH-flavin reductase
MKVVILGATGGSGRALVEQALEQGHTVTAFARDPAKIRTNHENLLIVKGNILDYRSVEAAFCCQDAALSALGVRVSAGPLVAVVIGCQLIARFAHLLGPAGWMVRFGAPILAALLLCGKTTMLSEAPKNIARAMETMGVKRFVCESSLGIGDSKGQLGFLYNYVLIPILLRNIFADKEVQEKIIRKSKLDWVIVRPAVLTNGKRLGAYRVGFNVDDKSIKNKISRADVADFMLKQLTCDDNLDTAISLYY